MRDDVDSEWNKGERGETELQRLDRNFSELLQELRVAQTGVQILFAFLLTLPFTQRFGQVGGYQRGVYFVTLLLAALASGLLIAPVSVHRVLFRQHDKRQLVMLANRMAISGMLALCLAITGALLLISDVLFGHLAGIVTALASAALFGYLWYAVPLLRLAERRGARHR